MRLGLHLGFAVPAMPADARAAFLGEAERLGIDSVWAGESTGFDAVAPLGWASAVTSRMRLGTAVLQIPARSPATTAMSVIALDRMSGGRVECVGLGLSTPVVAADWHGVGVDRPIARVREYVAVVRAALSGTRVSVPGSFYGVPSSDDGRPMRAQERMSQASIPIALAAFGPQMLRLCGEVADAWMPNHATVSFVRDGLASLPSGFPVYLNMQMAVADSADEARDLVRPILGLYFGMGTAKETSPYQQLLHRQGFGEVADEVWARCQARDVAGAGAAIVPEVLDQVAICGTPDQVARRLAEYRDVGVHTVVGVLNVAPDGEPLEALRALAGARG